MTLLFYRDNPENGVKEGAAGTKAIYLSDEKALRYFQDIYDKFNEDTKDEKIATAIRSIFETGSGHTVDGNDPFEVINEERHHFKIVRTSASGRLFYLWNPLLRTPFTAYHHRVRDWSSLRRSTIHDEVQRYFLDYATFYHCAAPIVEAAFDIENEAEKDRRGKSTQQDQAFPRDDHRYLAHLREGRTFLDMCRTGSIGWKSGAFDTEFLGSVIDAAFSEQFADRVNAGIPHYDKQVTPTSLVQFIAYHRPFWPALTTPSSWPVFASAALSIWKPAITHFSAVLRGNSTSSTAASPDLPGLWSPKGVIDPAGFSIGRRSLGSQEKPFHNPIDKTMSDLLWYVLSKSVELPFFYQHGWTELAIQKHLDETWAFLLQGKQHGQAPDDINVYSKTDLALQNLDELLIERFFKDHVIPCRTDSQFALDVFQEAREVVLRFMGGDLTIFGPAINVQYLQV